MSKSVNLDFRDNRQLESRMREIRQSGLEGGGAQINALSLPLSKRPFAKKTCTHYGLLGAKKYIYLEFFLPRCTLRTPVLNCIFFSFQGVIRPPV